MKKNKLLGTGITCMSALFLLTGCAQKAMSKDVIKEGKTQITFWYSGGKTAAGVMEEIIQDFNGSQNDWQVTGLQLADYDETYTKLQAGIAGGKAADLVLLDSDKSRNLADKNLLTDLTPYLSADSAFDSSDLLPVFFDPCRDNSGNIFAMPAYGTSQVLYYNKELFQQSGINPESLTTWQELAKAAQTIQKTTGNQVYGWEPMWGSGNLIDIAFSNGGTILSPDGLTVTIDSDEWIESWEAVRKWIHEEKIMRIHYGGQGWEYWYKTMDDVLTGKAAGYTGSSGDQADLDFTKVSAIEQPGFGSHPSAPAARVLQLVMPKSEKQETKKGAYAFMNYFADTSTQAKWSISTGYIPVRYSTLDNEDYKNHIAANPNALVPFNQAKHGSSVPVDPTGGKIFDALDIAADKVEIENIPAREALEEACQTAQRELDSINIKK